jgi:RNA polymerase sigma-70 factor (ECF subfamily)
MTLADIDAIGGIVDERDAAFAMDEEAFRAFYDRTSRGLAAYLARMTGDRQLAADLLQESYYRFLRATPGLDDEAHRRNYLYRIATNLVRDGRRRAVPDQISIDADATLDLAGETTPADRLERRRDLQRALAGLRQRDRELLWLAYANGSTHEEIASALGLRRASIKPLLFRARRRLAALLGQADGGSR